MDNKILCPACVSWTDNVEEQKHFYCIHCGSMLTIDGDKIKVLEITEDCIDKPITTNIECEYCGGIILPNADKMYICNICGETICNNCYSGYMNICKKCLLEEEQRKEKEEISSSKGDNILRIILYSSLVAFIAFLFWVLFECS